MINYISVQSFQLDFRYNFAVYCIFYVEVISLTLWHCHCEQAVVNWSCCRIYWHCESKSEGHWRQERHSVCNGSWEKIFLDPPCLPVNACCLHFTVLFFCSVCYNSLCFPSLFLSFLLFVDHMQLFFLQIFVVLIYWCPIMPQLTHCYVNGIGDCIFRAIALTFRDFNLADVVSQLVFNMF